MLYIRSDEICYLCLMNNMMANVERSVYQSVYFATIAIYHTFTPVVINKCQFITSVYLDLDLPQDFTAKYK